jgi:mannan polymerase II complex ANP1 subunit
MERERLAREQEEREKAEKAEKIKSSFDDPTSQWEKDKTEVHNMASNENTEKSQEDKITSPKDNTGDDAQKQDRKVDEGSSKAQDNRKEDTKDEELRGDTGRGGGPK